MDFTFRPSCYRFSLTSDRGPEGWSFSVSKIRNRLVPLLSTTIDFERVFCPQATRWPAPMGGYWRHGDPWCGMVAKAGPPNR